MKHKLVIAGVFFLSGLTVLSAATLAPALRMNIPFSFLAGNQTHNAGVYWVKIDLESQFVALRPVDSTVAERVILNGKHVGRNGLNLTKAFLRFERYGATYTLRAVGAPGAEDGRSVRPSKAENELVKASGSAAGFEVSVTQ